MNTTHQQIDQMQTYGNLSLGSRLRRLSDQMIQDVTEIYQQQGIELNPTFFPLFNLLYQQGALSITQAAEMLHVSHPAISKIAKQMIKEGWIDKTPDPEDIRRQLLTLTAQSEELLLDIKPIWQEIKDYLDQLMLQQPQHLLQALNQFEHALQQQGFIEPVLDRLNKKIQLNQVEVLNWQSELRNHFKSLNEAWLYKYFDGVMIDLDVEALNNPESYYLARGGYIWFARLEGEVVGCVALAKHTDLRFEISKMGVQEGLRGFGIGRQLLLTALEKARQLQAETVYLETNSKLKRALQLYKHVGFRTLPHPDGHSIYPRSDTYMQLQF